MSGFIRLSTITIALIASTIITCSANGGEKTYSSYGFYFTPEETIAALNAKGNKLSSLEHYVLANAYRENRNLKKAAVHYANCAFKYERNLSLKPYPGQIYPFITSWSIKSDYYQDSVFQLANIFFAYSEYEYSAKFAALVDTTDISLYRDAILIQSRSFEQMKKYDQAISLLNNSLREITQIGLTPIIHIRIASIYVKTKNYDKALSGFNKSLSITTEGWQGATAGKESYAILKNYKPNIHVDYSLIASGLVSAQEYDKALEILSRTNSQSQQASIAYVSAYTGKGRLSDADKIIVQKQSSNIDQLQLLSAKADILWNSGRRSEAIRTIKEIIHIPQTDTRRQFRRLCNYLYENNSVEAPAYLSLYEETFPNDRQSDKMLWLAAKPFIEKRNYQTAKLFLLRLIERHPESEYSGNARFWLYKIYSSDKNTLGAAESIFRSMPAYSPGSVYTWSLMIRKKGEYSIRSLEAMYDKGIQNKDRQLTHFAHAMLFIKTGNNDDRIDRMNEITARGINPWKKYNKTIEKVDFVSEYKDSLLALEKYYAAGDSESIQRVLNTIIVPDSEIIEKNNIDFDKALLISTFGYKYGNYYQQISGTSSLLENLNLQENLFLMNDEGISRIIPQGFKKLVSTYSNEFGVKKNILFAVIKAESAFNNKAVSGAGAVGMMQLMPPTAKDIAKSLKIKNYDMRRPADSIRFGAYYLAWLNRFFRGNTREIIAGYNAGVGNVLLWKKQYDYQDIDIFTEQIPFDETRKYMLFIDKFSIQYGLFIGK